MMNKAITIPVIDLFAGPGGLGEGFNMAECSDKNSCFKVCLAVEKDPMAHKTLKLRSFFSQFNRDDIPAEYYSLLRGDILQEELYSKFEKEAERAESEAWNVTLGEVSPEKVDEKIKNAVRNSSVWVLTGGPPCQVFSLVGRSRRGGIKTEDPRIYLYREFLRILNIHAPPVFVLENVKGMLSSKINGQSIFEKILDDLKNPEAAISRLNGKQRQSLRGDNYTIHSFVKNPGKNLLGKLIFNHIDYTIQCERYGIPQARHRVIFFGIRDDLTVTSPETLKTKSGQISVSDIILSLPEVRSGLSKEIDSADNWKLRIKNIVNQKWFHQLKVNDLDVYKEIKDTIENFTPPECNRGKEFIKYKFSNAFSLSSGYPGSIDHEIHG